MAGHRSRRTLTVAVAGALATLSLAAARPALASSAGGAPAHSFLTVMTRNLDEGTDFKYFVAASQGFMTFAQAVTLTYAEVLGSDVCGRAAHIADEIAAVQPDMVSVQEAAVWTGPLPANCPASGSLTKIDAQAALMARLAADGAAYTVVAAEDEVSSAPIAALLPGVSFLDRDLLLARVEPARQLTLSTPVSAHFSTVLPLPVGGGISVPILRGWISVDATVRGRTARVIATHLESFHEPVQYAEAVELAAGPAHTALPVILAGDLNTGPGSTQHATYDWLVSHAGGGFTDTWAVTRPGDPGFTDNYYTEDPLAPAVPSERIDLILVRNAAVPGAPKDFLVGTEIPHPSDHAGVVAKVTIPTA